MGNHNSAISGLMLVVRGQIKGRPVQNLLTGVLILISSLVLSVSLGIFSGLDRPFERMMDQAQGSHIMLVADSQVYDTEELASWWTAQAETRSLSRFEAVYISDNKPYRGEERLNTMVFYAEYRPDPVQDKLRFTSQAPGSSSTAPGHQEVWIPTSLANQYGLKVGDPLRLPLYRGLEEFTIAAVVVDPQYSSGYVNPVRLWLAPGRLAWAYPPEKLHQEILGIRLQDSSQAEELWGRFNDHLGGAFSGVAIQWSNLRFAFLWMLQLIAGGLMGVSILAALGCLLMVHSTVQGAIRQDYRQVGILKTLGYTPSQTTLVYVVQYALLAAAALLPGAFLGWLLSSGMLAGLAQSLGVPTGDGWEALISAAVPLPLFLIITVLAAASAAGKAGKISAMQAIRLGSAPEVVPAKSRSGLWKGALPSVMLLALGHLGQNRRRSLVTGLTVLFAAFVLLTGSSTLSLFTGISQDLGRWGFNDADLTVMRTGKRFSVSHDTLLQDLTPQPEVRNVVPQIPLEASFRPSPTAPVMTLYGNVFYGDPTLLGLVNLEGRHPAGGDEVSLGSNTAALAKAGVGDEVVLFLSARPLKFRVSGIFQAVGNTGHGFRLAPEGLQRFEPYREPSYYEVLLKDSGDRPALEDSLRARWGEAVELLDLRAQVLQVTTGMVSGLSAALVLVGLIFLGAALAAASGACAQDIQDSLRDLSLLKTLGYTPRQLRVSLVIKYALVGLLGSLGALVVSGIFEPALLGGALGSLGMVSYERTWGIQIPLILAFTTIFSGACALLPSRKLKTLKVRSLITE